MAAQYKDVSVDVLIVGAGPAGYMAAVTLARYGVDFRIIDQRAVTIQSGQASGMALLLILIVNFIPPE